MINPGSHPAVVSVQSTEHGELACQFGKSKTGEQNPFVIVKFTILRGPAARQSISWFGYFSEKTEPTTLKALRACGFTGDDIDKFCDQRPKQEVELVVEMEPGQDGRPPRLRVRWVNATNRGIKLEAPIAGSDLRKFGATLRAKLKAIPVVSGPNATFDDSQAAPAGDDGDQSALTGNDRGPDPLANDDLPF